MKNTYTELVEKLKRYNITYRAIRVATMTKGMNGGRGWSYTAIRTVLLYNYKGKAETETEIIDLVKKMIEAQEVAADLIAA